uniref:ARAD1B06226p n=1 Tax=Blastobotrys adeninivorans TaxID=409370 RepID=A0A060TAC8_BLAAD
MLPSRKAAREARVRGAGTRRVRATPLTISIESPKDDKGYVASKGKRRRTSQLPGVPEQPEQDQDKDQEREQERERERERERDQRESELDQQSEPLEQNFPPEILEENVQISPEVAVLEEPEEQVGQRESEPEELNSFMNENETAFEDLEASILSEPGRSAQDEDSDSDLEDLNEPELIGNNSALLSPTPGASEEPETQPQEFDEPREPEEADEPEEPEEPEQAAQELPVARASSQRTKKPPEARVKRQKVHPSRAISTTSTSSTGTNRKVNAVDMISTTCIPILESLIDSNEEPRLTNALQAYRDLIKERFFELSDKIDASIGLRSTLNRTSARLNSLRNELLTVREKRLQCHQQMEKIRQDHKQHKQYTSELRQIEALRTDLQGLKELAQGSAQDTQSSTNDSYSDEASIDSLMVNLAQLEPVISNWGALERLRALRMKLTRMDQALQNHSQD